MQVTLIWSADEFAWILFLFFDILLPFNREVAVITKAGFLYVRGVVAGIFIEQWGLRDHIHSQVTNTFSNLFFQRKGKKQWLWKQYLNPRGIKRKNEIVEERNKEKKRNLFIRWVLSYLKFYSIYGYLYLLTNKWMIYDKINIFTYLSIFILLL